MAPGDSRRRRDQRHRQRHRAAEAARLHGLVKAVVERLPPDLHVQIHRRLDFLHRLAFASICTASSGHVLRQEAPWLILPCTGQEEEEEEAKKQQVETSKVVSMADGRSAAFVRTAMRGHVIIGSSDGWLVTADDRAVLRMANPATGAQAALPTIYTIPFLYSLCAGQWFCLDLGPFVQIRFGGPPPEEDKDWGPHPPRSSTLTAPEMRERFYRKVVLSSSPRPGSYEAMLLTHKHIGAPAFATSSDPNWRMARSPGGVEDAIHHRGRFYSVTYAGDVEAWQRDAGSGEFTSRVVAPRLDCHHEASSVAEGSDRNKQQLRRKYLAVSTDGQQLMAVLKHSEVVQAPGQYAYGRDKPKARVFFKVMVLAEAQVVGNAAARWEKAADIGESALFVGVNGTVCVSTREHQGRIAAGCVYFTDDEVGVSNRYGYDVPDDTELREAGVYNLRTGKVERIVEPDERRGEPHWPPPAWFTPSFL
ncbi:hypothetical protein HU200_009342 [Digitaria exilis]|uniref:KIB1-4 beta-propeller domain-containing protein n=1 Tax=Digitaria exilis TaxID=1010633 RepID=A0A835KN66_9POAL|nr:hypothetical protein HU200_009342 [Digitaria exilis]CAB3487060.1 unnamed protein product [Digitaria exilis]